MTQSDMDDYRQNPLAKLLFSSLLYAKMRIVEKPWGVERIAEVGDMKFKIITVNKHQRTSIQMHRNKIEMLFPFEGHGIIVQHDPYGDGVDITSSILDQEGVLIMPHVIHHVAGPLTYLEITYGSDEDIIRFNDHYGRTTNE